MIHEGTKHIPSFHARFHARSPENCKSRIFIKGRGVHRALREFPSPWTFGDLSACRETANTSSVVSFLMYAVSNILVPIQETPSGTDTPWRNPIAQSHLAHNQPACLSRLFFPFFPRDPQCIFGRELRDRSCFASAWKTPKAFYPPRRQRQIGKRFARLVNRITPIKYRVLHFTIVARY